MKKIFLLYILAAWALPAAGQGVVFEELTLGQAMEKAQAGNKHIFVDVYTDWCGPCKMMDAQVFPLKETGDYFNPRFVSIKMNAEKGDEGPAFAAKFGIDSYPTFVILDARGELVHMFAGAVMGAAFIEKVAGAFDGHAFAALQKRYEAGERGKDFMPAYIQALESTHMDDVEGLIDEFYRSLDDEDRICEECLFMFEIRHAPLGSERERFMAANRERFREVFGREKVDAMFRKKYEIYFAQVVGGHIEATAAETGEIGARLDALGLANPGILPALRAAALVKVTGNGAGELFGTMKNAIPAATQDEREMLQYLILPSLEEMLDKGQMEELLALLAAKP